jgi:hypothetical protein
MHEVLHSRLLYAFMSWCLDTGRASEDNSAVLVFSESNKVVSGLCVLCKRCIKLIPNEMVVLDRLSICLISRTTLLVVMKFGTGGPLH